jgi:hypothetical protein
MPAESLFDCLGILSRDLQQRSCRAVRMATTLLPVPESGYAHANHERKLVLRFLELLPNGLNVFGSKGELPARLRFAAKDTASLANALVSFELLPNGLR